MKNIAKQAEPINSKEEYLSLFADDKRGKALKAALDIRKFEIELYWKRTTFFWAFIVSIYTGLFASLIKYIENPCRYAFFIPVIITLSGLGFFFAVAWHMVNKGSKFWQANWEKQVSLLEESKIGPLYDIFINPRQAKRKRFCPISEFDFSVTKINMWASSLIVLLSLMGWIMTAVWLWRPYIPKWQIIIPSVIVLLGLVLLAFFSDGNQNIKTISESNKPICKNTIDMIHIL